MTNGNYEQIATKIVVFAEPSLSQITPTSGPNAGNETSVLNFKAFHPNYTRNDKGAFEQQDSDWFTVKMYGKKAENVARHLKEGMVLEVRGSVTDKTFTGRDGQEHSVKEINASAIALSLEQNGIKSLQFERENKQKDKSEQKSEQPRRKSRASTAVR